MTAFNALDLLTANGKRSESENDGHGQRKLLDRERALLSCRAPRSEDREPLEDNTRERTSEVSLNSPRRRACGEEWGETTEEAERAREVRCERATPPSLAPAGAREAGARPRATDDSPEAREGRKPSGTQHQVHPETPPPLPLTT